MKISYCGTNMKVIYKQELRLGCGEQTFRFKGLVAVVQVELQLGVPCVWYMCDPEGVVEDVVFTTIGTGQEQEDEWLENNTYIDTYSVLDDTAWGVFVGHIFMRLE